MNQTKIDFSNEWLRLFILFIITAIIGGILFVINNLTGIFTSFVFIIQILIGIVFGLWYLRLIFIYIKELRKKDPEKKIGVPLGWAIFGLIVLLINFSIWTFLTTLAYNVPKILFFLPTAFALVQILHIFIKGNRRRVRDWVILLYNIFTFLHLLIWMFVDYGLDLPNFLGVFTHTLTSGVMWWQLIFVNTSAFFSPTIIFPPYMLNPRYYFAMPVEEYFAFKEESKVEETGEKVVEEKETTKRLPGERIPFFEERQKQKEMDEQLRAIREELSEKRGDQDIQYAEFVGSSDIAFGTRRLFIRFDNFLRVITTGVILILIILTPIMFAGNIAMNVLPTYQNINYTTKPNLVASVGGSVFSSDDFNGNYSINWESELENEISLAKELNITHLRYDVRSRARNNSASREKLEVGLPEIQSNGLKLIINIAGDVSFSKKELINYMYTDAKYFAENFQPDYMIIFNEINGELLNNLNQILTVEDLIDDINNLSSMIKSFSPLTKIVTTFLATENGLDDFSNLFNTTINIDVIGVSFYPVFFGWRFEIIQEYCDIFHQLKTSEKLWISETGMESLNYGENAQAKFLAKILDHVTNPNLFNADGVCIKSLIDNEGYPIERGIISHFGLTYYNGKKKKSFDMLKNIISNIL